MAANYEEHINKMFDSSLASQKETLQQNYDQNISDLDAQKQKAQQQTDANLTRTYVEAAKAAKNYGEVQNAQGLTSGAMAQARLARDNQLQSNLTTLRAAQQETDAEAERQRGLLAKQYMSAIAKAQADNDLQRAQALYEAAREEDAALLKQQKEAAALMAGAGDYSLYAALYGLTPEQLAKLQGAGTGGSTSGGYYGGNNGDNPDDDAEDTGPEDEDELVNAIMAAVEKGKGAAGNASAVLSRLYGTSTTTPAATAKPKASAVDQMWYRNS